MSHLFIGFLNPTVTIGLISPIGEYYFQLVNILQVVNQLDYNYSSNCIILVEHRQLLDNNWIV